MVRLKFIVFILYYLQLDVAWPKALDAKGLGLPINGRAL